MKAIAREDRGLPARIAGDIGRRITLVLGASASSNRRENDQTLGTTPDYDLHYDQVMPKLGLRWDTAGGACDVLLV